MKKNDFLDRIRREKQLELEIERHLTRQEMMDYAIIVLHEMFGFGPDRCKKFCDQVNEAVNEMDAIKRADTKDLEYTVSKFEEHVQAAAGPYYCEREERYR